MVTQYHLSHVMCHVSRLMCHVSPIICHLSSKFIFLKKKKKIMQQQKWIKGWSYSIEGLLSTGPTPSSLMNELVNEWQRSLLASWELRKCGAAVIECHSQKGSGPQTVTSVFFKHLPGNEKVRYQPWPSASYFCCCIDIVKLTTNFPRDMLMQ